MSHAPVVVVGGGPVGMTAALLLASHGVASTVLEASEQRDPIGSKALCMQRDVLDVLERVGCGDRLLDEGVTWTKGRTYFRDHELFEITFPEIGRNHYPPFVNVGQDRTEHWLERAVDDQPLVDLRYGHNVTHLEQSASQVSVTVQTPNGTVGLTGDFLIGADGSRSATRRLMGATFEGRSFDDRFLICDIKAELGFANERRFFFDPEWNPDRQVLIHPQADSVWRIDWQVPPEFDLEAEEASGGLDSRIRKIVGESDYEVVWRSVYRFHQRLASAFRQDRIFLAGDAAHLMSPFGARGLNSGVQDAENLAWKLAFVEQGWADDRLLDTYEVERRAAAEENLRITGETMDFLVPPTSELWERRRATLRSAVDNPNARQMVDSGHLAEPFTYSDSPLTTSGGGRSVIAPGALVPDAPVAVLDRPETTRLRTLFGSHFVVLTGERGDQVELNALGDTVPVEVYAVPDIDVDGVVGETLGLDDPTAAVIRPDGHLAGVASAESRAIRDVIGRAVGGELTPR